MLPCSQPGPRRGGVPPCLKLVAELSRAFEVYRLSEESEKSLEAVDLENIHLVDMLQQLVSGLGKGAWPEHGGEGAVSIPPSPPAATLSPLTVSVSLDAHPPIPQALALPYLFL